MQQIIQNIKDNQQDQGKFPFKHTVKWENKEKCQTRFVENLQFADLSVGMDVGMRSLLDNAVVRKHICDRLDYFCKQCGTNMTKVCEQEKHFLAEKLGRRKHKVIERKETLTKLKSDCLKCFKAG